MKTRTKIIIPTLILGVALIASRVNESIQNTSNAISFRINEIRATLASNDYVFTDVRPSVSENSIGVGAIMVDLNGVENRLSLISKGQGFQAAVFDEFGNRTNANCENVVPNDKNTIEYECRVQAGETQNIITLTLNY